MQSKRAEIVNYLNAGTAEFLRDKEGNFYFIEINSRLQVEHPVTELVTGLDLVRLQISIAQGEEISFKQRDLKMHGCSIECRINAEDPFYDFAPSVGTVGQCNLPQGPGIRVDHLPLPWMYCIRLLRLLGRKNNHMGPRPSRRLARE